MAKLTRVTQKPFGLSGDVGNYGEFGSKAAADPTYSQDPAAIQSRVAFTNNGWAAAVVDGNVPELEDMNGLFLLAFYQLTYLLQEGVPEWVNDTDYITNSIVKYNGVLYISLQNSNTNKQPDTQTAYWDTVIGAKGVQTGVMQAYGGSAAPTGYLICDGSAVSRSTYANLYAVIGTAFGAGNGTTTFNLPDLRERTPVGYKSGSVEFGSIGAVYGEKTHTLTLSETPVHSHVEQYSGNDGTSAGPYMSNSNAATSAAESNVSTSPAGGGGAHNNIQPSLTVNWIIKT